MPANAAGSPGEGETEGFGMAGSRGAIDPEAIRAGAECGPGRTPDRRKRKRKKVPRKKGKRRLRGGTGRAEEAPACLRDPSDGVVIPQGQASNSPFSGMAGMEGRENGQ